MVCQVVWIGGLIWFWYDDGLHGGQRYIEYSATVLASGWACRILGMPQLAATLITMLFPWAGAVLAVCLVFKVGLASDP